MLYYCGGLRIRIRCHPEHPDPKSIEHRLFSHYLSSKFMIKYYQNMSISKTFFVGSGFTFFRGSIPDTGHLHPDSEKSLTGPGRVGTGGWWVCRARPRRRSGWWWRIWRGGGAGGPGPPCVPGPKRCRPEVYSEPTLDHKVFAVKKKGGYKIFLGIL